MIQSQLLALVQARPFVPFTIHLASGKDVPVSHPESILYAGGRIAAVAVPEGHIELVDVFLVPSVKTQTMPGGERPHEPEESHTT